MNLSIKKQLQKVSYWNEIKKIVAKISQHNFSVLIVGGSVRDALLNKPIKDIDLATSATPEQIVKIFPKSNSSFSKYGTVFIPLKNKHKVEITTFRQDSPRTDGRRPQSVQYSSIKEDVKRRDFTINALFYDLKTDKIIDLVNGAKDLQSKKIRTVGKAEKRFKEDSLRMIRALRLAHQLNFKLDKEIQQAILKLNKDISAISKERVLEELRNMFYIGKIGCILKSLNDCGLFHQIFPQLNLERKYFKFWKKDFSFYPDPAFCWAAVGLPFFYSHTKKFEVFLKSYPIKTVVIKNSLFYLKSAQTLIDLKSSFTEQLMAFNGKKKQVYELTHNFLESGIMKSKDLQKLKRNLKFILKEFKKRETKNQLPSALVKGADLLKLSPAVPKQNFSKILKQAFIYQMENPTWNKKEILKKLGYK
ncbi:MAG: CCA tRNA nucleotidyltransferase [Oligoflexia bacterium]|nr:CCA tRNA nucleotidyltransferase [Oligoflexia bacterium]